MLAGAGWKKRTLVPFGSAMVAIAAQISVPIFLVPMALQTLAISVIGLYFGARMPGLTLPAYLAEGTLDLSVFANGGAGMVKQMGPKAGFLWGIVGIAFLTGWLAEHGLRGSVMRLSIAALIPAALLYVPGLLGLWPRSRHWQVRHDTKYVQTAHRYQPERFHTLETCSVDQWYELPHLFGRIGSFSKLNWTFRSENSIAELCRRKGRPQILTKCRRRQRLTSPKWSPH